MALSAASITLDEYLKTSYSPDCDFIDGVVEERNLGTRPHSRLQFAFQLLLSKYEDSEGVWIYPEQRLQTKPTRFRVPDICVMLDRTEELVLHSAPFLCIEILSPEDRLLRVEERLKEYLDMGVEFAWLVDPVSHEAWTYSDFGKQAIQDGVLRTSNPTLEIQLEDLFRVAER